MNVYHEFDFSKVKGWQVAQPDFEPKWPDSWIHVLKKLCYTILQIASITRAHKQLMLSFLLCGISNITFQYQGADTVKNDGIYSRYFTDYHGNGRYSLKVHAQARNNMARLSLRQPQNKALYIPGYIENGKWH